MVLGLGGITGSGADGVRSLGNGVKTVFLGSGSRRRVKKWTYVTPEQ